MGALHLQSNRSVCAVCCASNAILNKSDRNYDRGIFENSHGAHDSWWRQTRALEYCRFRPTDRSYGGEGCIESFQLHMY